jgi:hypothetical protein
MRGFEQLEDRRVLATIPVTLTSDALNPVNDGEITLREAISYVNGDPVPLADRSVFDFANLGTNDTITFAPGLSGDIDLTQGQINITDDVTIIG